MFAKLNAIGRQLTVWRTRHPDLAFDLAVVTVGLLLVAAPHFPDERLTVAPVEPPKTEASTVPHGRQRDQRAAMPVTSAVIVAEDHVQRVRTVHVRRPTSVDSGHERNWGRPTTQRLPPVPSPAAFFEAQRRLVAGQSQRASEAFSSLAAAHPGDPAAAYHLAVALYLADRQEEATTAAMRAATLERRYGLPGYGWLMERIQGPHRVWLERIRRPIVQH